MNNVLLETVSEYKILFLTSLKKRLVSRLGRRMEIKMNKIVLAKKEDYDEILKLYKSQLGREFCPWTEEYPTIEEIEFDMKRDSLFVMKDENGKIISSISIDEDPKVEALLVWSKEIFTGGELSRLAVDINYQNKGLARKMIEFGMEECKKRGFRSVHFLVNKYNTKALRSYSHLEFKNVGECFLYEQEYICFEKEI